jgi:hypothetical protein
MLPAGIKSMHMAGHSVLHVCDNVPIGVVGSSVLAHYASSAVYELQSGCLGVAGYTHQEWLCLSASSALRVKKQSVKSLLAATTPAAYKAAPW